MQKVLFAIGHPGAEKRLSELIAGDDFKVVGTMVSQDSVLDFLKKQDVDILVYREASIPGNQDDFKFVINLRIKYPSMRIVFIAGDREPGDKKIPTLITYAVYDIIAGQAVSTKDMADCVKNPKSLADVNKWLPTRVIKNGIFDDEDLPNGEEETQDTSKEIIEVSDVSEHDKKQKDKTDKKGFGMSLMGMFSQKKKDAIEADEQIPEPEITVEEMPIKQVADVEEPRSEPEVVEEPVEVEPKAEVEEAPIKTADDIPGPAPKFIPIPMPDDDDDLQPPEIPNIPEVTEEKEDYNLLSPKAKTPSPEPAPEPEPEPEPVSQPKQDRKPFFSKKPKDTANHMGTPLIDQMKVKEIKVPSRAATSDAEELHAAKKEIDALKRQLKDAEKRADQKDVDLEKAYEEYTNLQKQAETNAKQRICMFYGAMPGIGTSTIALNVATYLALKKYKVIYLEFNPMLPTLSYWYDLSEVTQSLDKAFVGIETRAYQDVNKNIVTKQTILDLESDMSDKHSKYPDLLHYMFFSDAFIKQGTPLSIAPTTLKDLLLLLLYKDGYDYVIIDMYAHCDYHLVEAVANFSTTNIFMMTQDVVTIGSSLRKFAALEATGLDFEMLKETDKNKKNSYESVQNFKNFYVINKFRPDAIFNPKRINEWLEAEDKTFYVPENTGEIYNALYKALPVILTSKNRDFVMQIKQIAESI